MTSTQPDREEGRIVVERDGAIARLTLFNPKRRNAVGYAMWQALPARLEALENDPEVRVVVLRGAGEQAFSAGADISEFAWWRADADRADRYDQTTARAMQALERFAKPIVARIAGYCIGAGFEIALACDIRVCSEDARFAVTPARLGLGYDLADTSRLVSRLGRLAVSEILFTGRQLDATEALRLGVVNKVVPAAELDRAVHGYASEIAANAPLTVRASKAIIAEASRPPGQRDEALCRRLVETCLASEDFAEGQRAFAEKRPPRFTGR